MNKIINQDFLITDDSPVPTPDMKLIQGKAYKQSGKLVSPVGAYDYFIERIKDSENEMEVFNLHTQGTDKMACALFELWVKNFDAMQTSNGEWTCFGSDYLPTELRMYADDSPYIVF